MPKLLKQTDLIYNILLEDEEARKDDYILCLRVLEKYIPVDRCSVRTAFERHIQFGLPSLHSIVRIRRALQVKHPELADDTARKTRAKEVQEYREFANQNKCS